MKKKRPIRHYDDIDYFLSGRKNTASATDYTGLIPSAVDDESDAEAYSEMMGIPMPHREYYEDD